MTWLRASGCERARFQAALAPDEVLSEVEERMLAKHLERCSSCRSFAGSVAALTNELRSAPAIRPEIDVMTAIAWPRRRSQRTLKLPLAALSTAAAVMMAVSFAVHGKPAGRVSRPNVVTPAPENDRAAFARVRQVVHARQLVPDYRSDSPGIYMG